MKSVSLYQRSHFSLSLAEGRNGYLRCLLRTQVHTGLQASSVSKNPVHISERMLASWPSPPLNFSSSWASHLGPPATPFSSEPCCLGYELSWSLSFALSGSLSLHPHLCPLFLLTTSSLLLYCFLTLLRTPPGASGCTPLTSIVKKFPLNPGHGAATPSVSTLCRAISSSNSNSQPLSTSTIPHPALWSR